MNMKFFNLISLLLTLVYAALVFHYDTAPYFNPNFAGQDARQQLFPLYDVIYPGLFGDDYITRAMRLYTGPLHEIAAEFLTRITESPIMTGHCIMVAQFFFASLFLFLTTYSFSSIPTACVSLAWLLHTPWLVRNTFGGLPRGWAGAIIAAFLYFLSTKNHKAILGLLVIGSLLHPHSTFLISAAYGFFLTITFLIPKYRNASKTPLLIFILFSPFLIGINYFSVKRPADIGTMVTLKEALNMPAFSKDGGRFPFVPLDPPLSEFKKASLRIFFEYDAKNPGQFRNKIIISLFVFYLLALLVQFLKKKEVIPLELIVYIGSVFFAYFLARLLAFRLYVPVRYMAWPLAIFFIVSIPVIIFRAFESKEKRSSLKSLAPLSLFVLLIYGVSGSNLGGGSNYRPGDGYDNPLYAWIRTNTPKAAVFAGHPTSIDGMQLYGVRKAYITTETAHPFYDKYNEVAEERIKNSFKALYAKDREEFLSAFADDKVDFFVFSEKFFKNPTYFMPHRNFVQKLGSLPEQEYFYSKIKNNKDLVVYSSDKEIVVDVSKVRAGNFIP